MELGVIRCQCEYACLDILRLGEELSAKRNTFEWAVRTRFEDDFDVGDQEALVAENMSRGVKFSFFDSLFLPLDGADHIADFPGDFSDREDEELVDFE